VSALSFSLQLGALLPVLLGVTLVRFIAMWHYARHRRVYPGFRPMVYAEMFVLISITASVARVGLGTNDMLVIVTNVALLAQPVLVYRGLGEYGRASHLRRRTAQGIWFAGLVCAAMVADVLLDPNVMRRALIYTMAAAVQFLRIAIELPLLSRRNLPGLRPLCFSYLLAGFIQIARWWHVFNEPGYGMQSLLYADQILAASIMFRILQSVFELYVVFTMNSAMLEDDLRSATAQIERLAHTDALTGALNRRGLELLGAEALRKSYALDQPAAVIMLDLDWFKNVNDTLGHAAGDELLRAISALCAGALRREDVFARYGGEEFVVVAPQTSVPEAQLLAQRMRQSVESTSFAATGGQRVTASFGVACARSGDLELLLKSADSALYEAKQTGRNKVVIAVPEARDGVRELDAVEG